MIGLKNIRLFTGFTLSKQAFPSQHLTPLKQPVIYGFINNENKETLTQKILHAVLMQIEENFERQCCIFGAYNWI